MKRPVKRVRKAKTLNLDLIPLSMPLFKFKWKGKVREVDILKLMAEFMPLMEALKQQPMALIPKFQRVLELEDMPVEVCLKLLSEILDEASKHAGDLTKKETSASPSSSTSTPE